jgi:hypothetical protein
LNFDLTNEKAQKMRGTNDGVDVFAPGEFELIRVDYTGASPVL